MYQAVTQESGSQFHVNRLITCRTVTYVVFKIHPCGMFIGLPDSFSSSRHTHPLNYTRTIKPDEFHSEIANDMYSFRAFGRCQRWGFFGPLCCYLHIEAIVRIRLHYSRHLINTQPQPGRDYSVMTQTEGVRKRFLIA